MKINLPIRIDVEQRYDFSFLKETMGKIIPGLKLKEVGELHFYWVGVFYVGSIKNPKVQRLIEKINNEMRKEEKEYFMEKRN